MRQNPFVHFVLAGLLMLLPFPALADVTATYSAQGKDRLVIEADEGGDFRAGLGDTFAIIRHDGVDYVVAADAAGDFKVARLDDVLALMAGQLVLSQTGENAALPATHFEMRAGAGENVAGYDGMIWLLGPAAAAPGKEPAKPIDVVISTDPALAPIGVVFRHILQLANPLIETMFGGEGNFGAVATELFAKGTPLRVGPALTLESVSTEDIAAARFALPGDVLEPIEFLQAITPSEGAGLPPLP